MAGIGPFLSGLSGFICTCALQRTSDLVIKTGDGETIVVPFTAVGPNAVPFEDVRGAAARINDLALQAQKRSDDK